MLSKKWFTEFEKRYLAFLKEEKKLMLKPNFKKDSCMKKIKMYFAMATLALMANQAQAGSDLCLYRFPQDKCGAITQISCSYKSRNGAKQEVRFELAEESDFRQIKGSLVELKLGASKESTSFTVRKEVKGAITTTHLYYQNKFFISDIHLSFDQETRTKTLFNPVKGSWTVDYPPVIRMDCGFVLPNH